MTKDELKGVISGLMREDDTPERIDAFNSILNGYDTDYEMKYNEMVEKYSELENKYRDTFKSILEPSTKEEIIETKTETDTVLENTTTWEDIFK